VLLQNHWAQVYEVTRGAFRWDLFGCVRGTRWTYEIANGAAETWEPKPLLLLRRTTVALVSTCYEECDGPLTDVISARLTGHESCYTDVPKVCFPPEPVDARLSANIGSLATRPDGSLAWIVCVQPENSDEPSDTRCRRSGSWRKEVWAQHATSTPETKPTLLAAGEDIRPRSIEISGSEVRWQQSGHVRTSRLPPP